MVKLNGSAGAIMSRCDGLRTVAEITTELEREFDASDLAADVDAFVAHALTMRWLEIDA
jgi:pyrroloquinoline quinone biosynthesis protein D